MTRIAALLVACVVWPTLSWGQAPCTTTLDPGANIGTTLSGAASGAVICLNSGNYSGWTSTGWTKSPRVTLRSVTPLGATVTSTIILHSNVNGITISAINAGGGLNIGASGTADGATVQNVTIENSNFGNDRLAVFAALMNQRNILIDGNTFTNYNSDGIEGRITVTKGGAAIGSVSIGVTISHNTFGPGGCSDGIQASARGIIIGPGNIFQGIQLPCSGVHADAIQSYGAHSTVVSGNFFDDNSIMLGYYDSEVSPSFINNVFRNCHDPSGGWAHFQMGGLTGTVPWQHNTFMDTTGTCLQSFGSKSGDPQNSGWVIENNIYIKTVQVDGSDQQDGCGADCIVRYNLKDGSSSTDPTGTNNIAGSPTMLGTCTVSTWSDCRLAPGSLGKNAGNDGQDMGTLYYGEAEAAVSTTGVSGGVRATGGVRF